MENVPVIPRGIRNRNPGNIRKSPADWIGKIEGDDPDFETFDTDVHGIRALARTLLSYQDKHKLRTIRHIISRWAPPKENNTASYIKMVAAAVGRFPDEEISLHNQDILIRLTTAIIRHENGQQPYSVQTITEGVNKALAYAKGTP